MESTKEEIQEWLHWKVTKDVFDQFKKDRDLLVEHLAEGHTLDSSVETARIVGKIDIFNYILTKEFIPADE